MDYASQPLSVRLRTETSAAHLQVESQLDLPKAIRNMDDYREYLVRFYQLYRPLEARLAAFQEWSVHGFDLESLRQTPRLASDLCMLSVAPILIQDAPGDLLPSLTSYAHAVGALYVLEGSTLGSQVILSSLENVLGGQISGATAFLSGHGRFTGESWKRFKRNLDLYGEQHLHEAAEVVEAAKRVFGCIGEWMRNDQHRR